jgi:uncharacterized small protein (DUF1192 family)
MTRDDLQQKITAIDAEIAQLEADRRNSIIASERDRLDAQIASKQETRQALEDAFNNLPAAGRATP